MVMPAGMPGMMDGCRGVGMPQGLPLQYTVASRHTLRQAVRSRRPGDLHSLTGHRHCLTEVGVGKEAPLAQMGMQMPEASEDVQLSDVGTEA